MRDRIVRACAALSLVLAACAALVLAYARAEEPRAVVATVEIPNGERPPIAASLHTPTKANGCAVVLASGQGGGRERPVVRVTAEALAAAGFTVVRFDWPFFTAGGTTPSEDLSVEADALDAAVAFAKALPGVEKLLVGGKSLGTMVIAERVAKRARAVEGLLLLTPPILQGGEPWPGAERLARTKIPTLVVVGDADPLCPLERLYPWAATFETPPRVVVVPGDHGLTTPKGLSGVAAPGDAERDRENVSLCAAAAVLWARRFVGS